MSGNKIMLLICESVFIIMFNIKYDLSIFDKILLSMPCVIVVFIGFTVDDIWRTLK